MLNTNDVLGALWSPDDGQINPVDATTVVAAAAKRHGVQIFENTPVLEILKNADGAVRGVRTDSGTIDCESVLLACGMWTRQIAGDAGANAPLWPCEHEYFLTESTPEAANLPVIRSYDEHLYMKCDAGKVGSFSGSVDLYPLFAFTPRHNNHTFETPFHITVSTAKNHMHPLQPTAMYPGTMRKSAPLPAC